MASATAALRHLRLKVAATSNPPSSYSPSCSCRLFLYPMLRSNEGPVLSCSAVSLRSGPHFRPGLSSRHYPFAREKKGKRCRNVVVASLFGVGAPEALVIGVVALLVFGPKGLAEVARNLGKTLRAFQPTIRELQQVSKEFKSTLEREIGLDEVVSSSPTNYNSATGTTTNQSSLLDPNGKPTAYSSEELLKVTEDQLAADAPAPTTNSQGSQDGKPTAYSSEELLKVTEDQLAASASATATADAPAPTTNSQGPEDSSISSQATQVEVTPVEASAAATSSEGPPSISESSSETKSSQKTTE